MLLDEGVDQLPGGLFALRVEIAERLELIVGGFAA
jgi:hypothetical protein